MVRRVGNSLTSFYQRQFQTVDSAWTARRGTFSVRANLLQSIINGTNNPAEVKNNTQTALSEYQAVEDAVASLTKTFEGNTNLITDTQNLLVSAKPFLNEACQLANTGRTEEAYDLLLSSYTPIMDQIRTNLITVGQQADANAAARVEEGEKLASTAVVVVIVLVGISVVFSIALAFSISHGIRKPIEEIRNASQEIVKGNMNAEISYQSSDELGELAGNMRELLGCVRFIISDVNRVLSAMADGNFQTGITDQERYIGDFSQLYESVHSLRIIMSDTLRQIETSADQVNSGADQVSTGAQSLAQGAAEQASSVEELAATINEISNHINVTAEHARSAQEETDQAHDAITVCSSQMQELVGAINMIENKSQEIGKIIKTIEDIAFQTNILALNAAVEAARAGTAGKGFAVVADEVRNLAGKSAEASKMTAALIEEAVSAVKTGTELSGQTEDSLSLVVQKAADVLSSVSQISDAAVEQANAVTQVTTGIDQISSVVQTNSATAEQSAAASQELSGQAAILKDLVSRFQLAASDD